MKGVFITGTDTGVGKTIISAALMSAFPNAHYWKPVQSGSEEDDDTRSVRELAETGSSRCWDHGYRLIIPASPHHAAEAENVEITLEGINKYKPTSDGPWIVEGAGGLLVPLSRTLLLTDLIQALGLSVIVVSATRLGTINHSLMTLRTLKTMGIPTLGLVLNGDRDPSALSGIGAFSNEALLLETPATENVTPEFVHTIGRDFANNPRLQAALS